MTPEQFGQYLDQLKPIMRKIEALGVKGFEVATKQAVISASVTIALTLAIAVIVTVVLWRWSKSVHADMERSFAHEFSQGLQTVVAGVLSRSPQEIQQRHFYRTPVDELSNEQLAEKNFADLFTEVGRNSDYRERERDIDERRQYAVNVRIIATWSSVVTWVVAALILAANLPKLLNPAWYALEMLLNIR
jgi:hypothetical protein